MTRDEHHDINPVVRRFIEDGGALTQALGVGRVLGQIYAYLFFSPEPRNLSDMQHALGISKGSASMGVRQLEQWGAVRQVWVRGDRKDYYKAEVWLGGIFRRAVSDTVGKRIESSATMLAECEQMMAAGGNGNDKSEAEFIQERLAYLRSFQKKARTVWRNPLLQRLLR